MAERVLPNHLRSFSSFEAGSTIATEMLNEFRSKHPVVSVLATTLDQERPNIIEAALVCEIIADSRGHDCGFRYWNVHVKRMLKETGFRANAELTEMGIRRIQQLMKLEKVEAEWRPGLEKLLTRMRSSPQNADLDGLELTRSQYKKISVGLKGVAYGFGVVNNILSFYNPTFERSLEATALAPSEVSELSGAFESEPSDEDTECMKLVLQHFCSNLTSVRCDAQKRFIGPVTEKSISFWDGLKAQFCELSKLRCFETTDLVVSEDVALALLQLPELFLFRVTAFSPEISQEVHFGERFISAALKKESLRVLDIPSLSMPLIEQVRSAPSRPMLSVNGRMVVERSEGRGRSEVGSG